ASAVDEIAISARAADSSKAGPGGTGAVLFKLASYYAKASTALSADQVLPDDDRRRLADQYAVSAVRLLNCARLVGFFDQSRTKNLEALDRDPDLAPLRQRDDYKFFRDRLPGKK